MHAGGLDAGRERRDERRDTVREVQESLADDPVALEDLRLDLRYLDQLARALAIVQLIEPSLVVLALRPVLVVPLRLLRDHRRGRLAAERTGERGGGRRAANSTLPCE